MLRSLLRAATALTLLAAGAASAQEAPLARIPLVPADTQDPILKPMFDGIRARGGEPLNMHRTVGNAPKIFKSYAEMAFAIRAQAVVSRADRELIILRATHNHHGDYEFTQHRPMGVSCGLTQAQVDAVPNWRNSTVFGEKQRAVLAYADGKASADGVDDATFAALKRFYSPQEIVELTVTAAFYAAAAQVTRSLGVKLEKNAGTSGYGKC